MFRIKFEKHTVVAKIRNPLKNFEVTEEIIEVRKDPLIGNTMRICQPKGLDKIPEGNLLEEFVLQSKPCFFCNEKVDTQTPMLPKEIYESGRIKVGESILFPNLSGFGRYSGVCIFSKDHFISIEKFTKDQIFNALKACQIYFEKCFNYEKKILYPSINWNYLLPAGSSILHPHLQPFLDPYPTNYHRIILEKSHDFKEELGVDFWTELKKAEQSGPRFLYKDEFWYWLVPFAPSGFNEINAFTQENKIFTELSNTALQKLAEGIVKVLKFYKNVKHNSFNLVLFSSPITKDNDRFKIPCILKMVTRPVFQPLYRNDVTFFEKFHAETMIDQKPEDVANNFKERM